MAQKGNRNAAKLSDEQRQAIIDAIQLEGTSRKTVMIKWGIQHNSYITNLLKGTTGAHLRRKPWLPPEERARHARELLAKGWSAPEVAEHLDVDEGNVYRWANGDRYPHAGGKVRPKREHVQSSTFIDNVIAADYTGGGLSQRKIAAKIGVSREFVSKRVKALGLKKGATP